MATARFSIGYGNVYGDYWKQDEKGWLERVPGQAYKIKAMEVDGFVALELHAEHSAHAPLMDALGKDWAVALGAGGNLFLYRRSVFEILKAQDVKMPDRWMTRWNVRHRATKVRFWVVGAHLSANGRDGTKVIDRADIRVAQTRFLVRQTLTLWRAILCADLNSATSSPGYPHAILAAARWLSIRVTSQAAVENVRMDSHGTSGKGNWIEGIFTKPLVTVHRAAGVPTNGLSDHTLWFKADVSIKG